MSNEAYSGGEGSVPHKRIVKLPSGKIIEITWYNNPESQDSSPELPNNSQELQDLSICPNCDQDLVQPVEWDEVSATHWRIELQCPNCDWSKVDVYDNATAEKFDERLNTDEELVLKFLKRLTHQNMKEDADRFIDALDADHILPEDF
jgi:hypothetical protein